MGILSAYIATMGVIGYRWFKQAKQPPPPVAIAAVTGIYGAISLIGKNEEAQTFAGTLAWAVFLGALAAPALPINAVQAVYGTPTGTAVDSPEYQALLKQMPHSAAPGKGGSVNRGGSPTR